MERVELLGCLEENLDEGGVVKQVVNENQHCEMSEN